jgi:hypothetical protein
MNLSKLVSLIVFAVFFIGFALVVPMSVFAQEQSRESAAQDATATQWSLQFAYQGLPLYHTDEISPGVTRPEGEQGFLQFRMVAPLPKGMIAPITMLPRLTVRLGQAQDGTWGLKPTELFWLFIVSDWGTGRFGIGPLVTFPAFDSKYGSTKWEFGFSTAAIQRSFNDKLLWGLLLSQAWGKGVDANDPDKIAATPIGINPFLSLTLGDGFYVSNGEMVLLYNWQLSEFYFPFAVRLGKVIVKEEGSWNIYIEYKNSMFYQNWSGPAVKDGYRVNVSYTIPIQ